MMRIQRTGGGSRRVGRAPTQRRAMGPRPGLPGSHCLDSLINPGAPPQHGAPYYTTTHCTMVHPPTTSSHFCTSSRCTMMHHCKVMKFAPWYVIEHQQSPWCTFTSVHLQHLHHGTPTAPSPWRTTLIMMLHQLTHIAPCRTYNYQNAGIKH